MYNILRTFYPDDLLNAHNRLLAAYPLFDLNDVLLKTTYIATDTSTAAAIKLSEEIKHDVCSKQMRMPSWEEIQ